MSHAIDEVKQIFRPEIKRGDIVKMNQDEYFSYRQLTQICKVQQDTLEEAARRLNVKTGTHMFLFGGVGALGFVLGITGLQGTPLLFICCGCLSVLLPLFIARFE